jgi:hypothetical protein
LPPTSGKVADEGLTIETRREIMSSDVSSGGG